MKTYTAISILLLFTLIFCAGKNAQTDNETDTTVIVSEFTGSVRTDEYLYIGGRRYEYKLSELDNVNEFRLLLHPYDRSQSNSLEGIELLKNVNYLIIKTENTWDDISGIDFSPLNSLKNLRELKLLYATFNVMPDFSGISSLEWIYIDKCKIMSLNGIETASQIKTLTIFFEDHYFGSFELLSGLTNLTSLLIYGATLGRTEEKTAVRVADFSGLENLKRLTIDRITTIDLAGIQNLQNLEYLKIGFDEGSNVTNIEAVAELHNLKELYLSIYHGSIASLSFLSSMSSLSRLDLTGNDNYPIAINDIDVTPLQSLPNIEYLSLRNFTIRNFHLLDNLPKLTGVGTIDSMFDPTDNNKLQNAYVEYQIER